MAVADRLYDARAVVLAYVDAQRPGYPHEDFRTFRQARLKALEDAYGIVMDRTFFPTIRQRTLWMHFSAAVGSYLSLRGPRDGMLEEGLLEVSIDALGEPGIAVREVEHRLYEHLRACRADHEELLTRLFVALWGDIERPLTSSDLRLRGFDDDKEPTWRDYLDYM